MNRPLSTLWWDPTTGDSPIRRWWKHNWLWAGPLAALIIYAFSMALGPLLLASPLIYLGYRQVRKRTERERKASEELGFAFEAGPVENLGARFGEFRCFDPAPTGFNIGRNLMTGTVAGHAVTVMDHSWGGGGRSGPDVRETVAVFPAAAPGLTDLALSPGGDAVLARLDSAGWTVQTHRGAVAIFRYGSLSPPAELRGFLAEAATVLGAFETGSSSARTTPVTAGRTTRLTDRGTLTISGRVALVAFASMFAAIFIALLAQADSLLNALWVALALASPFLFVAPVILLLRRARLKRAAAQRVACERLGFTLEPGPVRELGVRFGVFPWLSRSGGRHEARGLMTGSRHGQQVTLLDHSYESIRETLAVFPDGAKGLPDFELLPRGERFGSWALDASDLDIRFPENPAFSDHYELRGKDEAAVRSAFGATTLAFFASRQQCWVETRGGAMTVYRFATQIAPDALPAFLDDAITVLGAFA